jgi:hypothetical protein
LGLFHRSTVLATPLSMANLQQAEIIGEAINAMMAELATTDT